MSLVEFDAHLKSSSILFQIELNITASINCIDFLALRNVKPSYINIYIVQFFVVFKNRLHLV